MTSSSTATSTWTRPDGAVDRDPGLDAYQVVGLYPGAAGTVVNGTHGGGTGVGHVVPFAVVGDDGEEYELQQALGRLPAVEERRGY
ncbi:MAG: hypothetical protein U0797_27315 [Gemmataceae bacterium]